jgi:hypothetical protein
LGKDCLQPAAANMHVRGAKARRPATPRQVARAAGALALAPLAKRLLDSVQARLRLRTRRAAFLCVLGACLLAALCVFGCVAATFV